MENNEYFFYEHMFSDATNLIAIKPLSGNDVEVIDPASIIYVITA